MRQITITQQDAGQRLDRWLGKYMQEAPKSFFYKMLRKKNIKLNGKKAEGMEKLQPGDVITLYLADDTIDSFRGAVTDKPIKIPFIKLDVVYEDEDILVINKPIGMLSQKADKRDVSIVEYVSVYLQKKGDLTQQQLETFRPGICNRLDRNTSGLIVAGKTVRGLQWMNELFRKRDLQKHYLCIVSGKVKESRHITGYLLKNESSNIVKISTKPMEGGDYIETEYEPMSYGSLEGQAYTLLRVHLITGKSHQIRAHLQSIGHPIIGDGKYGRKDLYPLFAKRYGLHHQLLHAWTLELGAPEYLPEKYHHIKFTAPLTSIFLRIRQDMDM